MMQNNAPGSSANGSSPAAGSRRPRQQEPKIEVSPTEVPRRQGVTDGAWDGQDVLAVEEALQDDRRRNESTPGIQLFHHDKCVMMEVSIEFPIHGSLHGCRHTSAAGEEPGGVGGCCHVCWPTSLQGQAAVRWYPQRGTQHRRHHQCESFDCVYLLCMPAPLKTHQE